MLKQLIQRLLDSRTTPSEAAHNASSIYTEPTWFNGTPTVGDSWTDNLYTGTAPSDGYLNVSGSANINTANAGSMIQAKISGAQISQVTPMAGQGFNMMAPISKGATFSVNGIRLADITVRFFKSIGGGYNRFVRRALPCLRPSFNYLPKVFLRAKNRGFVVSRTAGTTLLQSHSLLEHLLHTWRLRMESLLLLELHAQPLTSLFKAHTCGSTWRDRRNKSLLAMFRCQKDSRFISLFLETISKATQLNSFQHSVQTNLQTGGALC